MPANQPLTVAAAHRHELYAQNAERLYRHAHLSPEDPGLAWLITHNLAEHHPARATRTIVPWLHEAMNTRLMRPRNAESRLPRRFI